MFDKVAILISITVIQLVWPSSHHFHSVPADVAPVRLAVLITRLSPVVLPRAVPPEILSLRMLFLGPFLFHCIFLEHVRIRSVCGRKIFIELLQRPVFIVLARAFDSANFLGGRTAGLGGTVTLTGLLSDRPRLNPLQLAVRVHIVAKIPLFV